MNDGVRNIHAALDSIEAYWQPHRLTSVDDIDVKIVKLLGEFVWHTHADSEELFLVVAGELIIQMRDGDVTLGPNDVFVVPAGVEHCPLAHEEVHAVLVERKGMANTGDQGRDRTSPLRELS